MTPDQTGGRHRSDHHGGVDANPAGQPFTLIVPAGFSVEPLNRNISISRSTMHCIRIKVLALFQTAP